MKKIYITIIIGILLVGTLTAAGFAAFNTRPVVFEKPPARVALTPTPYIVHCDRNNIEVNATEPDGKWDRGDIMQKFSRYCDVAFEVSYNGDKFEEDETYPNCYGFDREKIKSCVCGKQDSDYDEIKGECKERPTEVTP